MFTNKRRQMKNVVAILFLLMFAPAVFAQQQVPPEIAALQNEKNSKTLEEKISKLRNSDKEEDLTLLARYYMMQRDSEKYKEINKLAAEKFPKGQAAYSAAMQVMQGE